MSIMNIVNGRRVWKNEAGQKHREGGPGILGQNHPAIEYVSIGGKQWWINNLRHRVEGPGNLGQIHPAFEYKNGSKVWFLYGRQSSKQKFINLLIQYDLKLQLLSQIR
jgi:hypothetical protein